MKIFTISKSRNGSTLMTIRPEGISLTESSPRYSNFIEYDEETDQITPSDAKRVLRERVTQLKNEIKEMEEAMDQLPQQEPITQEEIQILVERQDEEKLEGQEELGEFLERTGRRGLRL